MRLINKLLRKEEIGRGDGTIYLNRWTLIRTKKNGLLSKIGLGDLRVYIHQFATSDHTKCLHDHPNKMISFIFWNGYEEEYWDVKTQSKKRAMYKAPILRMFPASHCHRVDLLNNKPSWSIVLMWPKQREWGFFLTDKDETGGKRRRWVEWKTYRDKYGDIGGCS